MPDFAAARHNMVESQIRPNRVVDPRLIAAMEEMPRERFVPKTLQSIAYIDEDLRVAEGRWLMEPMVFARLLQMARIEPGDVVLDVGCASGYSTAVIARLASTVMALESDAELAARATETLTELHIDNAAVVEGRLEEGLPKQAPYDVIVLEGAVREVPKAILDQLAEGGRLVTVVAKETGMGRGTLFLRAHGVVSRREEFDAATPLLPGFAPEPGFVF